MRQDIELISMSCMIGTPTVPQASFTYVYQAQIIHTLKYRKDRQTHRNSASALSFSCLVFYVRSRSMPFIIFKETLAAGRKSLMLVDTQL